MREADAACVNFTQTWVTLGVGSHRIERKGILASTMLSSHSGMGVNWGCLGLLLRSRCRFGFGQAGIVF